MGQKSHMKQKHSMNGNSDPVLIYWEQLDMYLTYVHENNRISFNLNSRIKLRSIVHHSYYS